MPRLLRTDDIRRYLQDKKGEIKEKTRRWSMCSDSSDCSTSSIRSLPQYSSYRAFSSQGSFNKMSGLPTAKSKSSKIVPRGLTSKEESRNGKASGIPTPGAVSRENSFTKSQLPVMKRETSTPNMKRESSIPLIKREDSMPHIKTPSQKSAQKTPSRPSSAQSLQKKETPSVIRREGSLSQIKKGTPGVVKPRGAATSTPPPTSGTSSETLKVGDRVSITGSSKRGVIQYIGETRFAKGDWAGIVLDEPVGKNDGTVAGVRYFQCQPNCGVFVKVEKLVKLADINDPNYKPHGTTTPNLSSDGSKEVKTPSVSRITPVRSSDVAKPPDDLKVGDYVSIGDTRAGYLRYLGETGFAKGVWCGVELKEPLGKNDGAVAGTRYFQCEPKYGLFAPLHKVAKILDPKSSEEKVMTAEIDVVQQEQTKAEDIDIMKTVEDVKETEKSPVVEELDSSSRSKIASMQLQLQDRENEIKKLLKDREVDRTDSNSLLEQYHQSENKLTSLRISYEKLQRESDNEVKRLQGVASNAEKMKASFEIRLEEERRKAEDLQFQLEELIVTKELSSEADKENVALLEEQLQSKDVEIENLQKTIEESKSKEDDLQNKYSDLEFQLAETNEREIQSSQSMNVLQSKLKELEEALNEAKTDSDEHSEGLTAELTKRDSEIKQLKNELEAKTTGNSDLEFQIKKYRDEVKEIIESKGALNKDIFDLNAQIDAKNNEIITFQSNIETLKSNNNDIKSKLKTVEAKVESLSTEKSKLEEEVSQLTKTSGDSSSQVAYVNEQLQAAKRENTVLQDEKSSLVVRVDSLMQTIEDLKEASAKEKSKLEDEQVKISKELQETISSLNETVASLKLQNSGLEDDVKRSAEELKISSEKQDALEKKIAETEEVLKAKDSEMVRLSNENEEKSVTHTKFHDEILSLKTILESKESELETLQQSKSEAEIKRDDLSSTYDKLKLENDSLSSETKSLKEKLDMLTKQLDTLNEEKSQICEIKDAKMNELEHEKNELEKQKTAIDSQNSELITKCEGINKQLLVAQEEARIFKDKMNSLQADLSAGSDLTGKLQHEVFLMREEVTACKEKISMLENTRDKLQETCDGVNAEKNEVLMESKKLLQSKANLEGEIKTLKNSLEESMQREVTIRQSLEDDRIKLQNSVETSLSQLQQKEGELSSWRVKAQHLEKKVIDQESQIKELERLNIEKQGKEAEIQDNGISENDVVISKFKEELENKNNEVKFLNSVVVDLQNKFKAAEEKIRLLESGEGLFTESEGLDDTISPVKPGVKQRMFCDICDEFDLHETEDCPTQSSLDDIGTQYHAERGEERPYCVICEVFGHSTENCDDEETF